MQVSRPLVSILIPTYNGQKYLSATIKSVEAQTYPKTQVIFCDDCSTDKTPQIIEKFRQKHPGTEYYRSPSNNGPARNWNSCLKKAKGKYLKFIFQDDIPIPQAVEKLTDFAQNHPDVCLISSQHQLANAQNKTIQTRSLFQTTQAIKGSHLAKKLIQKGNIIGGPTSVLLKAAVVRKVGGFNEQLKNYVDLELWLRLLMKGNFGYLSINLNKSRLHPQSLTNQLIQKNLDIADYYRFCEVLSRERLLTKLLRKQTPLSGHCRTYWSRLRSQHWGSFKWTKQCLTWILEGEMNPSAAAKAASSYWIFTKS